MNAKGSDRSPSTVILTADVKSVADLFEIVMRSDGNFQPKAPSAVTDGEDRPVAVYHGTNRNFWEFDPELVAYWFSKAKDYAEAMAEERGGDRVMSAYLDIKILCGYLWRREYLQIQRQKHHISAEQRGKVMTASYFRLTQKIR